MESIIRLQKFLSDNGIASRRSAEKHILAGDVRVNNKIIKELGYKVNIKEDKVFFKNNLIKSDSLEKIYILLNKPLGAVSTVKEQFGRDTIIDLIQGVEKRIVPVGRLDMYTTGAIILTNDGEFVYKLTHPKYEISKTYIVTIKGQISASELKMLENGIKIEDYITSKAKAKIIKINKDKNITRIEIIIHEGKNRQVRRMFEMLGKKVVALHRAKIGNLDVKDLKIGTWRYLNKKEIKQFL